ncbi:taurine dioxygenase [Herbaspirillum sp. Sphag1AN]|uniref:TauD/TfdA dioxygenase family protein n=1 Tax=unclassified Herbaspirillum TaxID=2624150 RepID=UPI00162258E8|nr:MULTISPECIES: TauD/TfdA family dioxygenase [unclassified Herbaspirillum]MBB3211759.1 taurine dioxygenase [Herbaspirillum sp. Sphag1AN]MBB3244973.1 taurine dioxygenase [Herbaspirillum sp. Sphag64]
MNALVNPPVPTYEHINVQPLSLHIGAEISGVDLTQPLLPAVVAEVRAALLQWKVIFFRDQHLSHAQQVAFGKQFGELTLGHPVFGYVPGHPEVYSVGRDRLPNRFEGPRLVRPWTGWHTDVTAAVNPPAASILRGVVVPPYGGDTQWTNLVAAYHGLSPTLRSFVDTLQGEHRFTPPEGNRGKQEFVSKVAARPLVSHHPLVRVHPETGERALYVSPSFLKNIVGLHPRESEQLLTLLFEHVVRPEYTVRFKWQEGSLAFWDNRSTAHLAPVDFYDSDFDRQLYRITLVGDVPVGPDGKSSVSIEGEPVLAHSVE